MNFLKKHITKIKPHDWVGFVPGMPRLFNISKSMNIIYHRNRTNGKMRIITGDAETACNKIQQLSVMKKIFFKNPEESKDRKELALTW